MASAPGTPTGRASESAPPTRPRAVLVDDFDNAEDWKDLPALVEDRLDALDGEQRRRIARETLSYTVSSTVSPSHWNKIT